MVYPLEICQNDRLFRNVMVALAGQKKQSTGSKYSAQCIVAIQNFRRLLVTIVAPV